MNKRRLITIIFAILSIAFAVACVVIFLSAATNFRSIGIPFFLCLIGFGVSSVTACALVIFKKDPVTLIKCPNCGTDLDEDSAFCKQCGKAIEKEKN